MMSALTRKHAEAKRLLETFTIYKDHEDQDMRRKAHVDLDRFLMENRETAIICMEQVLQAEIESQLAEARKHTKLVQDKKPPLMQRLAKTFTWRRRAEGGASDGAQIQSHTTSGDA